MVGFGCSRGFWRGGWGLMAFGKRKGYGVGEVEGRTGLYWDEVIERVLMRYETWKYLEYLGLSSTSEWI